MKTTGNVSVPAASFASKTSEGSYVIHVTSRWGLLFEILLYTAGTEGVGDDIGRAVGAETTAPDSYRLLNVYKLYVSDSSTSTRQI